MRNSTNNIAKIIIPKKPGNGHVSQELLDSLKSISRKDIENIAKEMEKVKNDRIKAEKEKEEKIKSELMGNKDAILEDLKENHVKFGNHIERLGEVGQIVHLDLPAVGNFKGFKFDYFISERDIYKRDFDKQKEFVEHSYSKEEVVELLKAMNEYMQEYGVYMDKDFNQYENVWRLTYNTAEECLRSILGLYGNYRMKDGYKSGLLSNSRTSRMFLNDLSRFEDVKKGYAHLLLKLSD